MKILITGGAGFIGSNLIRHLLNSTDHEVLNIDMLCFPGSIYTIADLSEFETYTFLQQDISDIRLMSDTIMEFLPDAVIHLAAESHVDRSIDSPGAFINSNIVGTFSLLEAFRQYTKTCSDTKKTELRFIHVSTDEVFGSLEENELAFTEIHPYSPNSPYSASKAASDHLVRAWHATYQLPVIVTNCSNNYGPYQFPEKLIPVVINKALAGETIPVYGKGENIRDWLHVNDHVRALNLILEKGIPGESYNIGGDNEVSNIELVNSICDILNEAKPTNFSYHKLIQFVQDRPGHDLRYAIDSKKIQSALGWRAEQNFSEGLANTVNWYMDNQTWCAQVSKDSYSGQRLGVTN
ncbi:MAG: dTDP-glucose 4,6-dehydratase [Gammaproteobacteria bacterium]|nr:dTDP-glucose 4,6-dehydratase [Gammaproteobacteria bacterium]